MFHKAQYSVSVERPCPMETVTFTCTAPVLIIYYTASPDPMNCTASLLPPWNGTISGHSVPAIPGTQVTFQCDDGLFPEGTMNVICLPTGEWDKNSWEIVCRIEPSKLLI